MFMKKSKVLSFITAAALVISSCPMAITAEELSANSETVTEIMTDSTTEEIGSEEVFELESNEVQESTEIVSTENNSDDFLIVEDEPEYEETVEDGSIWDEMIIEDAIDANSAPTETECMETELETENDTEVEMETEVQLDLIEEENFLSEGTTSLYSDEEENTSITFSYDSETATLTINGQGRMNDFSKIEDIPWGSYATKAKNLVINEGITCIGEMSFYNFWYLESVKLPSSLSEIGIASFYGTSQLKKISIPESVTVIGDYAFQESGLTSIKLSSSIQSFKYTTVYRCYYLSSIDVDKNNPYFTSQDGVLFNKDQSILYIYPADKSDVSYSIPNTVRELDEFAFSYSNLSDITITSSVTTIKTYCFYNSRLASVQIPSSVTSLERFVFAECSFLKEANISANITSIENGCFGNCTSLETVVLPSGLLGINYQAFLNCSSLEKITFPDGIQRIHRYSFYGSGLTSVNVPKSVKLIGENAFPATTEIVINNPNSHLQENGTLMETYNIPVEVSYDYTEAFNVLDIVNKERIAIGLNPLEMDQELLNNAMHRAAETSVFFDHTRPNTLDCVTINPNKIVGENIAVGDYSAENVMSSWMNSPGHKYNILYKNYKSIGIGAVKVNGVNYWVQCFSPVTADTTSAEQYTNATLMTDIAIIPPEDDISDYVDYTINAIADSEILVGETKTVKVKINNSFLETPIKSEYWNFTSSDPNVCTVSPDGVIEGKGRGKAVITASLKTGERISASCEIECFYPINRSEISDVTPVIYSGIAHTPEITVTYENRTLKQNVDYELKYYNNTNAGTAYIVITGIGDYQGRKSKEFIIQQKEIADLAEYDVLGWDYSGYSSSYTYFEKNLVIKYESKVLLSGSDYEITSFSAGNNIVCNMSIRFTGNYGGTKLIHNIQLCALRDILDHDYTGDPIIPEIHVTHYSYGDILTEDVDYTVSIKDNIEKGTATVTLTGIGDYRGTLTGTFRIVGPSDPSTIHPLDISNLIEYSFPKWNYTGYSFSYPFIVDNFKVFYNKKELQMNTDFDVSYYYTNDSLDVTEMHIEFKGMYKGEKDIYLINNAYVPSIQDQIFTGKEITPKVTVYASKYEMNKTLTLGKDYRLTYSNNTKTGTAQVTLTGIGNYYGVLNVPFNIKTSSNASTNNTQSGGTSSGNSAGSTTKKTFTAKLKTTTFSYTGKAITPSVTVKQGTKTLTKGKHYTLQYSSNKKIGTATVTIKGKGSYSGITKKIKFNIIPKKLNSLTVKSNSKGTVTAKWKKDSAVGGYQIYVSTNKKFSSGTKKYTVKKNSTTQYTAKKLKSKKTYYVKVRAFKTVSGKTLYGSWSSIKKIKVR